LLTPVVPAGGTHKPIVPFREILKDGFKWRYGVGAFNIINDLTMKTGL
jgi:hypothetical protein